MHGSMVVWYFLRLSISVYRGAFILRCSQSYLAVFSTRLIPFSDGQSEMCHPPETSFSTGGLTGGALYYAEHVLTIEVTGYHLARCSIYKCFRHAQYL